MPWAAPERLADLYFIGKSLFYTGHEKDAVCNQNITLNQRVQGSSPCAPHHKLQTKQDDLEKLITVWRASNTL
jgi:hypothetical protein